MQQVTCAGGGAADARACSCGGSCGGGNAKSVTFNGRSFPHDPFLTPLVNSGWLDLVGSDTVAAGEQKRLVSLNLGKSEWAVIKGYGQGVNDDPAGAAIEAFGQLTWWLALDGARLAPYESIRNQIGQVHLMRPVLIRIDRPGATLEAWVESAAGAPQSYLAAVSMYGWTIPF